MAARGAASGPGRAVGDCFPLVPLRSAFASRNKAVASLPSSASLQLLRAAVQFRSACDLFALKAATGAVAAHEEPLPTRIDREDEFGFFHASSRTARVLDVTQLYGPWPTRMKLILAPSPTNAVSGALTDVFDAFASMRSGTRLEPDPEDLLLATVNAFHRAAAKVQ